MGSLSIKDPDTGEMIKVTGGPGLDTLDTRYPNKTAPQVINQLWNFEEGLQQDGVELVKAEYFIDVRTHGALLDGTTDDATAINAAINAANAAGGGRVVAPYGKTALIQSSIILKDNVHLDLPITIKCGTSVITAALSGTSGNTVSDVTIDNPFMVIDGDFATTGDNIKGIQITNGARITIKDIRVKNFGDAAIVLQGLNAAGGTPDSKVIDCRITNVGLADGTTGAGVLIKDASTDCEVSGNIMRGVKGGMGVQLNGGGGTGYPLRCSITDNVIHMAASTTGFEAIGLTAGCEWCDISSNRIYNSQDNGVSASASYTTVTGNTINGALNSGISSGGSYNTISGNIIRNIGQQYLTDGLDYSGVRLGTSTGCVVEGNVIIDDQGTPTMANGVKFTASLGGNKVSGNYISGNRLARFVGAHADDDIIDVERPLAGGYAADSAAKMMAARVPLAPYFAGDAFQRADGASLGTAESGQAWTAQQGVPGIVSKRAYATTVATTKGVMTTPADGYFELSIEAFGSTGYLMVRNVDTSNYWRLGFTNSTTLALQKVVAGSSTTPYVVTTTFWAGTRLGLLVNGSSISAYRDGKHLVTTTDTFNQTAVLAGFATADTTTRFGQFLVRNLVNGT